MSRPIDHGGEEQGVESAPRVQAPAVDFEGVRGLAQRQAVADDVAVVVPLGAQGLFECRGHTLDGPAKGQRERGGRNRLALREFA